MNALVNLNNEPTMTSKELLEVINAARALCGESLVRHNQFIEKIKDELEGDHYKIFVVSNENNTKSEVAELNKDQCQLVSMRESKAVRRQVLAKLKSMDEQKATPALTANEMFLQIAQSMVDSERRAAQQEVRLTAIEQKIEQGFDSQVVSHRPTNCESITHIRTKVNQKYGLPSWVTDEILKNMPFSPKVAYLVRNNNEDAQGSTYEVWHTKDIGGAVRMFLSGCELVSGCFATHPAIDRKFKINAEVLA